MQFSSSRKHDAIFTKLRLGHNGLKRHRKYNIGEGFCTRCSNQDFESLDHILFGRESNREAGRKLESTMYKLGYQKHVSHQLAIPTPQAHGSCGWGGNEFPQRY